MVHLTGTGKGGRNQEIALAGAKLLDGLAGTALFSLGSDGTDGPTDAAGGIVTGETAGTLREAGVDIDRVLKDNDAYHALAKADGLIFTGPTGTNVNDLTVLLIRRGKTKPTFFRLPLQAALFCKNDFPGTDVIRYNSAKIPYRPGNFFLSKGQPPF